MPDVPNLLVLSQVVPETCYAGSLLLHRLLNEYPPDCLLVIGPSPQARSEILSCRYESLGVPWRRWESTRFSHAVRTLRLFGALPRPTLRQVKSRLGGFQPQVILSIMQVEAYYGLAARFAREQSLPLALIVHDLPEVFEPVLTWAAKAQMSRYAAVYNAASKRLCISPQMRDRLHTIYGVDGDVLYPNRSENLTPRDPAQSASLKTPGVLTLGYAGSLAYGYGRQIVKMFPALEKTHTRLRLYATTRLPAESDCVEYAGFASKAETTWERVKDECDAVILPYTWDADHRALYETHFPSKLPEYLALRMPVLVAGPASATGVRWALDHPGSALVLTEQAPAAWENALCTLRDDAVLRKKLATTAWKTGTESFDPVRIRGDFVSVLGELARNANTLTKV